MLIPENNWEHVFPGVLLLVEPENSPVVLIVPDPRHLGKYEYLLLPNGSLMLVLEINRTIVPEFQKRPTKYLKVLNIKTKEYGYFPIEDLHRVTVIIPDSDKKYVV